MNDCFWGFVEGVCGCAYCNNCKDYISVNSDDGMKLYDKYQADIEEALKPVSEKWKLIKNKQSEEL